MAETKDKQLTQVQRGYLVKRINEIANSKIKDLGGVTDYGAPARGYYGRSSSAPVVTKHTVDKEAVQAILKNEVKLQSKANMLDGLKALVSDKNTRYFQLSCLIFIDLDSLEKFNVARNEKKKADREAKEKRIVAVRTAADSLKDSVMLDGTLAIELLEEFEKKEF